MRFFFFFVRYTGRLLTQREKGERSSRTLVPSSHLLIPVLGREVPLLVLSESQKHFVYSGTDLSLASLTSKRRAVLGTLLLCFLFLFLICEFKCRNVFEGCRGRTSH